MPNYHSMKMLKKSSMQCAAILIIDFNFAKNIRFEQEHCYAANKGSIGTIEIKQIIKECLLQTCNNLG